MAATTEVGNPSDSGAVGGRTSRSSVSSESTIRSGGSPGTKQIETSFCGARPIGSISSFDYGERESSACGPSEEAAVKIPPGRDGIPVRLLIQAILGQNATAAREVLTKMPSLRQQGGHFGQDPWSRRG